MGGTRPLALQGGGQFVSPFSTVGWIIQMPRDAAHREALGDTGCSFLGASVNRSIFLSAVALCVVALLPAKAQLFESQHGQQGPVAFSADEAKVLERLASFRMLPAEEWRFHEGDVAHGESPALDDSSWATVKTKSKAGKDAVWYRRWIEVPKTLHGYDLRGANISLSLIHISE